MLGRRDADRIREELTEHLALLTEEYARAGLPLDEARRRARLKLGPHNAIAEAYGDQQRLRVLDGFWQDARLALRSCLRQPGFTLVTVVTLASVCALNISLVTFFSALALRAPAGIHHPADVVSLYPATAQREPPVFTIGEYETLAEQSSTLAMAAAVPGRTVDAGHRGALGAARTLIVSATFFETLQIPIVAGRSFGPDDDRMASPQPVVLLSERLWDDRLGRDPAVIGHTIPLNNVPYVIVGVVTREFRGLEAPASFPGESWLQWAFETA